MGVAAEEIGVSMGLESTFGSCLTQSPGKLWGTKMLSTRRSGGQGWCVVLSFNLHLSDVALILF